MTIRALHVINTMAPGGAETLLMRLCPRLREFGVEPFVASMRGPGVVSAALEQAGVPSIDLSRGGRPDARAPLWLYRAIRST